MMRFQNVVSGVALCSLVVLGCVVFSCQGAGGTPPPETGDSVDVERPPEPDEQVFAPLGGPLSEAPVPFLMNEHDEVSETPCLQRAAQVETGDAGVRAHEAAKTHEAAVTKVLRAWIAEKVAPAAVSESVIDRWEIEPESILSASVGSAEFRFVEDPQCISEETGLPEEGSRMVVELFGATRLVFSARTPLDRATAELLRDECAAAGLTFEADGILDVAPPAVEEEEESSKEAEPTKTAAAEDDEAEAEPTKASPEPEELQLRSWTIASPEPVYFAYRRASAEQWRRELHEDRCNVNLVWGDPTFRLPRCSDYRDSGFAAVEVDGQVRVRIETGGEVHEETMDFDETRRVRVDDQHVLWITPSRIEEGVLVRVNSVVLGSEP